MILRFKKRKKDKRYLNIKNRIKRRLNRLDKNWFKNQKLKNKNEN